MLLMCLGPSAPVDEVFGTKIAISLRPMSWPVTVRVPELVRKVLQFILVFSLLEHKTLV